MKAALRPALYLMGHLRLKAKFIVIICVSLAPILVLSFFLLSELNQDITVVEHELHGMKLIVPTKQIMITIAKARGMTNGYLNGEKGLKDGIFQVYSEVDNEIKKLLTIEQVGVIPLDTGIEEIILPIWRKLKDSALRLTSEQSFLLHTELIALVEKRLRYYATEAKLQHDTSGSNAALIDIIVHRAPPLIEAIGQLRGIGAGVLVSGRSESVVQEKVALLVDRIRYQQIFFIEKGSDLEGNYSRLSQSLLDVDVILNEFFEATKSEIIEKNKYNFDAEKYFTMGSEVISEIVRFSDEAIPVVNKVLTSHVVNHRFIERTVLGVIIASLTLLIYLLLGFYFNMISSLKSLHKKAERVAAGNLVLSSSSSPSSSDEIGELFYSLDKISLGVSQTISSIKRTSCNFVEVANRLTNSSQITENSVSSQVRDSSATSQSIAELSNMVEDVAESIANAARSAKSASEATNNGQKVVMETIGSINELASGLGDVSVVVNKLENDSREIESILNVIQDIADQTNLLALNAAIEAARAGENGRGFAVVADEVRNLAQKTQNSVSEIQSMIDQLQAVSGKAVATMKLSSEQADRSVEHAKSTGVVLNEITELVSSISEMNSRIAVSADEQSSMAKTLNSNVINMSAAANQSASVAKSALEDSTRVLALASETESFLCRFLIDQQLIDADKKSRHDIFIWDETYSVGLNEIDRQHKILIGMINELNFHVKENHNISYIQRIFQGLIDYTISHFGYEEGLIERHEYENIVVHKEKHKKLIAQLQDLQARVLAEEENIFNELLEFLNAWLSKHIKAADKHYAVALKAKGVDSEGMLMSTEKNVESDIDLF